jgi:6-pyruvoyl-tetrahydropterin synthase
MPRGGKREGAGRPPSDPDGLIVMTAKVAQRHLDVLDELDHAHLVDDAHPHGQGRSLALRELLDAIREGEALRKAVDRALRARRKAATT